VKLSPLNKKVYKKVAKENHTQVHFDREKKSFVGLEPALKKLEETYLGVDIHKELKKMEVWLLSTKGRARTGNINFILNWLSRAVPTPVSTDPYDSVLASCLEDYCTDLWEKNRHILEMNTVRR